MYLVPFVEDEHTVFLKTISRVGRPRSSTSGRSLTMKLEADEKELLESVERGEWKSTGAGRAYPLRALRQGDVPEGSAAEHPALE